MTTTAHSPTNREIYADAYGRKYARHWDLGHGPNPPIRRHVDAAKLAASLCGVRVALDVGCGAGQILRLARAAGIVVVGTEIVPTLFDRQLAGFEVHLAALPNLPFPDRSFDLAFAVDVLEHLDEPLVAPSIDELHRVTSKFLVVEVSSEPWHWTMADGQRVDVHRTQRSLEWWREQIARKFDDVVARGDVVAWVKKL